MRHCITPLAATIALIGFSAVGLAAQSGPAIQGPTLRERTHAECVKRASDWQTNGLRSATERTMAVSNAFLVEARRIAKECGARLSANATTAPALRELHDYYTFIGDTANMRLTLDRGLATAGATPRDRGVLLTAAMRREISAAAGYFGVLEGAERFVAQIDALPDSLADIKIAAHQTMLNQYRYLDVASGLQSHSTALITLGRRTKNRQVMINAFQGLARASADMLRPEAALEILDDAERELGGAVPAFSDFRERYALIGTRAAPITGKWWVNSTAPEEVIQPGNGKVTVIEFTAHWCAPCTNSYPGLKQLAMHYQGKPFEIVMVTDLYGYLGTQRSLTPEQEVEADREYYARKHGMPFKVAINPRTPFQPGRTRAPTLDDAYRVGGIPQIMIVDQKGAIRQIVTGWDHGNTERFKTYIDGLLKER